MHGLVIRPIVEPDLALLRAFFDEGTPEQPEAGLATQRAGTGAFLIALLDASPVGYLALYWNPEPNSPASWNGNVAYLSEFVVLEEHRSHGIGSEMMRVAERMAAAKGFRRMTLGVGVDIEGARRFYERLGYVDAGIEPITDGGSFRRWDGTLHEWQETWRFMDKDLTSALRKEDA